VGRVSIAATALALASSIAPAEKPQPLPTYTPAYQPQSVDERGMWMEADEYERKLRDSPLVIHDEALNAYVRRVLCRTVGDDRCKSVRIYIMEVPAFNASMAANGTLIVWSGLLLRARSEAELGSVLGHEFAHFELRHLLSAFKQQRTATDIGAWAVVLGGLSGTNTTYLQLSLIGSIYRFSRQQEEAADVLGFQYLAQSPYPASAAADIWRGLMAENDATAVGRKHRPRQRYFAGFFDTHPTELKRAIYLAAAAAKLNDPGDPEVAGHRAGIGKFLPQFLAAQIKLNDFGGTEYVLAQLASSSGWTGDLLFARGELYRLRGNPRDLVSAADFYGQAIAQGYASPDARRNRGLALVRSGQAIEGKALLQEYLRLSPDASDAKAISALLAN
jgi:Zn-dependent protease with chaperone function